jgi:hypothetical protein
MCALSLTLNWAGMDGGFAGGVAKDSCLCCLPQSSFLATFSLAVIDISVMSAQHNHHLFNIPVSQTGVHTNCTSLSDPRGLFATLVSFEYDNSRNLSVAGPHLFSASSSSWQRAAFVPPQPGTCFASPSAEVHTANLYSVSSSARQTHCRLRLDSDLDVRAADRCAQHR